jgi:hypothetical protein
LLARLNARYRLRALAPGAEFVLQDLHGDGPFSDRTTRPRLTSFKAHVRRNARQETFMSSIPAAELTLS